MEAFVTYKTNWKAAKELPLSPSIAAIRFRGQRLYVRHVLTHAEYDRGKWKSK